MATNEDLMRKILRDIRVELTDEFDRNFERQGFFGDTWKRRSSPMRGNGHILVSTGQLRRSIRSKSDESSVTFTSSLPYASIHNDGGKIRVTAKMKRYFWHKYYEATGGFRRRKDGSLSRSKKQTHLSKVADYWKALALMKVGDYIEMPKRRFLGTSPVLESQVRSIIDTDIQEHYETQLNNIDKK